VTTVNSIDRWIDNAGMDWDRFGDWLAAHEVQADVGTVWILVFGFSLLALVKFLTWWTITRQRDRTSVGWWLKRQKMAETIMFACLVILYSASLTLYYGHGDVLLTFWARMALRVILALGIIVAVYSGLRFVQALRSQNFGQPDAGVMDSRDTRQNARTERQQQRHRQQDRREVAQDARQDAMDAEGMP
jgi:hypothetical protein